MPTPLYDALKQYAGQDPIRFHMPGHKGKYLPVPELSGLAKIDVTELPPTGNLYAAGEPFDLAQELWAEKFGFEVCQFLTGGSTQGIHTGLALCCAPGDKVLIDRNCHRAVFHALALLGLEPVYLERPWLGKESLIGPIRAEYVENFLAGHGDIKTICITSPTYAGVLSNVAEIGAAVHAKGGKLFVDGAHGAHLPFLDVDAFSGADVVVVSAHKTLPAMGQSALLFANGFDRELVRQRASIYGSSSPSYPMMASMDVARQWLEEVGAADYRRTADRVARLRERFPCLRGPALDPTRLTLNVKDGPAFARALEERGIHPEMEDGRHVVFICTAQDGAEDFERLEQALTELSEGLDWERSGAPLPPPPLPRQVMSPRQALFAPQERRALDSCAGVISAGQIAPYPPGVPVVAPGELISKKELAYLNDIGYNTRLEVPIVAGR